MKQAIVLLLTLLAASAQAESYRTGPFSKGHSSVSIIAGSGSAFNDNYIILGGGYGYYVADGLELGLDAQYWFSGDPTILRLSPQIKYVVPVEAKLQPYVGVFYRRTFVNDSRFEDQDSYGSRLGVYFSSHSGVYLGGGIVYEKYADCTFGDCSNSYPELLISISM